MAAGGIRHCLRIRLIDQAAAKDDDAKELNLSFAQIKNSCYCCGKNHKLPYCPDRHKVAKDDWHINKTKEAKQYQSFVTNEIKSTMVEDLS